MSIPDHVLDAEPLGVVAARVWYARDVLAVAVDLLGATITSRSPEGDVTVRLTEVEAYAGEDDPGSHAARGRTARNAPMFAEPGRLYVYRHLGLHHCLNVVAQPTGSAAAVLLRAGEVVDGVDLARSRRGPTVPDRDLARGPARLAMALDVDKRAHGSFLLDGSGPVLLTPAPVPAGPVESGPRVGVAGGAETPWRFWLAGDPTVSVYRRHTPRRRGTLPGRTPSSP
ncbi:MAG TPA: DNA-3-methyladenine glycosylase [Rugosimonospora sp.]|nr:DNA-3-methyladenine glycosylase [Rugosimonospora sp.]